MVDACRTGPDDQPFIHFTVFSMHDADLVVRFRCCLKGSAFTIFDVLSPEERRHHELLWPTFLLAKSQQLKAQFQRASLWVEGVLVPLKV